MKRDLVIAMTGTRGRIGKALAARLRAEGHTVVPVPRELGQLPGSNLLIHLGRDTRRLAARLPDAVTLPENVVTTAAGLQSAEQLGIRVCPLKLNDLRPEEAVDLILWAVHLLENHLCLD